MLPNLRWVPSTAAEPNAEHMAYWNTVLPISHPFWSRHKPGDRWGCQCSLEATDDPVTNTPTSIDHASPGLDNNPGKDGRIFSESHPYFPDSCQDCPFNKGGVSGLFNNKAKDCEGCQYIPFPKISEAIGERRTEILNESREKFQGKSISREDVGNIMISRASIKEFLNQPHKHYSEKNELMLKIDEVISSAEYLGDTPPFKQSAKNAEVIRQHIFEIDLAGEKSWIIVWEYKDGTKILHSISDSEKLKIKR